MIEVLDKKIETSRLMLKMEVLGFIDKLIDDIQSNKQVNIVAKLIELETKISALDKEMDRVRGSFYDLTDNHNMYIYEAWKIGKTLISKYNLTEKEINDLQTLGLRDPFEDYDNQFDGPPIQYNF